MKVNNTENINPLVSVSVLAYNHESFIRECLDGIMMQKTKFKFEVLIHDDASTDNSAEIIKEYEKKYPNTIKPIYQTENQHQKKIGIDKTFQFPRARGKYIAFCEGDDYWIDPLKLQKQVDFLEANPEYSMCFHNAIVLESKSDIRKVSLFNSYTSDCDLLINDLIRKWVVPTASIVCRRDYLSNPEWLVNIYSGDFSLLLNMFTKGRIRYIDMISSVYRKNLIGNSVSVTVNSNFVREQHIKLLESFNIGTGKIYNQEIVSHIKMLRKEIALREGIWQHKYYKLIFMLPQIWKNRFRIFK